MSARKRIVCGGGNKIGEPPWVYRRAWTKFWHLPYLECNGPETCLERDLVIARGLPRAQRHVTLKRSTRLGDRDRS